MPDLIQRIIVLQPAASPVADAADFATVIAMLVAAAAVFVSLFIYYHDKRPDIIAYLDADPEKSSVYFVIENVGKGIAYDVMVDGFDFGIAEDGVFRNMAEKSFINKGVPMLVPGKSRSTIIATPRYATNSLTEVSSEVDVSFYRKAIIGKRKQSNRFVLDCYSFSNILRTDSDMHLIARGIKKMAGIR